MNELSYRIEPFGEIAFVAEELNAGHDFVVRANCHRDDLDMLVFLDSRGISADFDGSVADRLIACVEGRPYLLVCRPLELTTWATFVNFMHVNSLKPSMIVTNMGFVDFTPKKLSILEDAVRQVEYGFGANVAMASFIENYNAADGAPIDLFSMQYGPRYAERINGVLDSATAIVLNTPPIRAGVRFPRHRPESFFRMIDEANAFNRGLRARVIDFSAFDTRQTYDGVHYTAEGNTTVFEAVRRCL